MANGNQSGKRVQNLTTALTAVYAGHFMVRTVRNKRACLEATRGGISGSINACGIVLNRSKKSGLTFN
jgi:hypothetical protein